jgi:hypothetical protein
LSLLLNWLLYEDNQTMINDIVLLITQMQDVPLKTQRLVVRVCDIVTRRAARLAAAGIVAVLQKIGRDGSLCGTTLVRKIRGEPKRSVVAIEGGLQKIQYIGRSLASLNDFRYFDFR